MQAQLDLFSAEHPDVLPETADFLCLLREQTERMSQMTKTLLEMSELRTVPCVDQIEIAPMVEEIFADLSPLGAFYALLNKVSFLGMKVDKNKCVSCGKCAKACKMDVDVTKSPDHTECIRCGMCVRACPTDAVKFRYGFCNGKDNICSGKSLKKQKISNKDKE